MTIKITLRDEDYIKLLDIYDEEGLMIGLLDYPPFRNLVNIKVEKEDKRYECYREENKR